jgi:CheY-like chemotaxis protein
MATKILYAADNTVMLTMMSVMLSHSGYHIHRAESVDAALKALANLKPDVLIIDLASPDTGNVELCKRVRSNPRSARLPILLVGPSDTDYQAKSLAAGASYYITKPIFLDHLLKALDELLQPVVQRE